MSLINLRDLLSHARKNKYAVGAFAIANMDFIDLLLECAVEKKSPIILLLAEVHFKYIDIEKFSHVVLDAAERAEIPVCVGLDHGQKFASIIKAIKCGFTTVMFDASDYSYEENIEMTKEIVKIAHSVNVSVEGEVGYIGREIDPNNLNQDSELTDSELFTKVEDAVNYCNKTNIDALAIAIGNVHGFYKGEPNLDFKRLAELNKALNVPLVLHGGSGISDEDYRKAINLGICKINYFTQMSVTAVSKIRSFLQSNKSFYSYPDLVKIALEEVKSDVRDKLEIFGSASKINSQNSLCLSCTEFACGLGEKSEKEPIYNNFSYDDLTRRISDEVTKNIRKIINF